MEAHELQLVVADLQYLREHWAPAAGGESPRDQELHRGAQSLVRLLNFGLRDAWRSLGLASTEKPEPTVLGNDIDLSPPLPPVYATIADAAFEYAEGVPITPHTLPPSRTPERTYLVSHYRDAPALATDGALISRGDLIAYFATAFGGVSLAPKTELEQQAAALSERITPFEWRFTVLNTEGLRFALREIGRRITESSDVTLIEQRVLKQPQATSNSNTTVEHLPFMTRDRLAVLQAGVCAIGHLVDPTVEGIGNKIEPNFLVLGTGFVVRPGVVITTRTVAKRINAKAEAKQVPPDSCRVLFYRLEFGTIYTDLYRFQSCVWVNEVTQNIGVIGYVPDESKRITPLACVNNFQLVVGQPVAALGFGFGRCSLPGDVDRMPKETEDYPHRYRIGPLLNSGHLAAVSPYEISHKIDRLILDIRVSPTMLGGPIVDPETGLVLGLCHDSADWLSAFAIPLDTPAVGRILSTSDQYTASKGAQ
jgi:Trypsin-like peptidase domain